MAGIFSDVRSGSMERVKALFDFEKKVEVTDKVELPPVVLIDIYAEPVDPLMESIRVQLSTDRGQTWSIIKNLYGNQETGEYIFPWRVPPLKKDEPTWLQIVAVDIWGRSVELRKPVILSEGMSFE